MTRKNILMLIRFCTLALLILFFVPWFSVSCANQEIPLSGLDLAFGKTVSGQHTESNILVLILLLLPVLAMFAVTGIRLAKNGKLLAGLSSIISIIFMLFIRGEVNRRADLQMLKTADKSGYYLTIAANIIILWAVIYDRYFLPLEKPDAEKPAQISE